MRNHFAPWIGAALVFFAICSQPLSTPAQSAVAAGRRVVTDMAGRKVSLPVQINRIVTVGAVPVINSFIFAFGDGDKIANGLPVNFSSPRYKFQLRFAPSLATKPKLEGGNHSPNLEQLVLLNPDVVFTMDRETADLLESKGFAVVFLAWRQPEDVKQLVRLVGQVLNKPSVAEDYARYFDQTVKRVTAASARVPLDRRLHVLYLNVKRLSEDHLIAEWWIETAGGISVTHNGRQTEAYVFSLEQLLAWNPDVLFVTSFQDVADLYQDPHFAHLKAVQSHRVYVVPVGAHLWANRTIEQPLTLIWAAQKMYPDRFKNLDMIKEMQAFYAQFFHYSMSAEEAQELLDGPK